MTIQFQRTVPVFRIFSLDKHRFEPDAPVYMQVSRDDLVVHLSEHHGDGTPGSVAYVYMTGVRELHRELSDKNYRNLRPGLQQQEWGMTELGVIDPFHNNIIFGERTEAMSA